MRESIAAHSLISAASYTLCAHLFDGVTVETPRDRLVTWLRRPPVRIVAFVDQGAVSAGNFIAGMLMAREFGAREFGSFALAWLIVEFMASLQFALVLQPMLNIGAKEDAADQDRYYSAIAIQQAILAIGAAILIFIALAGIGAHFDRSLGHLALPLCAATISFQGYNFFRRYFFMRDRPGIALASDLLRIVLQIGGILALPVLSWPGTAVSGVWIVAAACAVSTCIGISLFGRFQWKQATFRRLVTRHWTFSKWLLPSALMFWLTSQAFVLMSGIVLGAAATGSLMVAISITGIITLLYQALDNFAPKQASQALQSGGPDSLVHYLMRLGLFMSALVGFLVLLISGDADFIVRLVYGQKFEGLGYIVHWMCATSVVFGLFVLLNIWAAAIERTQLIFLSYAAATMFAVVAAYPLTSMFGLHGVLWGALLVELIKTSVLIVAFFRWKLRIDPASHSPTLGSVAK